MESRLGGSTFRPDMDSGTDESGDFLWTRLQFKINRLGTASASSLEPLRDKWVTFTHKEFTKSMHFLRQKGALDKSDPRSS